MTSSINIKAIDVHGHYGKCCGFHEYINTFRTADLTQVEKRAEYSHIEATIVSPLEGLFPRLHGDPISGNTHASSEIEKLNSIYQYVIINPLVSETYIQAENMLKTKHCVGIKIHPEEHGYHIKDHGKEIFEFASKNSAIILSHSGEKNSLPIDFVTFTNQYPNVKLILAHCGLGPGGDPTHQVRAIQKSRFGNIYTDTSSAMNITPGILEWAVKEVGARHILFGTDTPLYFTAMQRARIDHAELNDQEKKLILRENALSLFSFPFQ